MDYETDDDEKPSVTEAGVAYMHDPIELDRQLVLARAVHARTPKAFVEGSGRFVSKRGDLALLIKALVKRIDVLRSQDETRAHNSAMGVGKGGRSGY